MATMDRYAPKPSGLRDPRNVQKKNNLFWNYPRYLYFGGAPGSPRQAGTKGIDVSAGDGQHAAGPISDRGKGRR